MLSAAIQAAVSTSLQTAAQVVLLASSTMVRTESDKTRLDYRLANTASMDKEVRGPRPYPPALDLLTSTGLTDSHGRGCILTPPTTQWQCDAGATPTPGFSIGPDGSLTYNGGTQYFTCPTEDHGGWNLYSNTLAGEPKCEPVHLIADSCVASTPPATPPTSTGPPAVPSKCPAELPEHYEFPHYIKPISSSEPTKSFGNSYNGTAGHGLSSIFNFDIPPTDKGKLCNIKFLFPMLDQLETSAFSYETGPGFEFSLLDGPAVEDTTYNTSPKSHMTYGNFQMTPGGAYDIASIACPAGEKLAVGFKAIGSSYLDFFQE